jgi:carbamate kinase
VTHGNGPQVGLLALQSQALPGIEPYPLDVLGAETEGMIGYLIEQELASIFPSSDVATLLTQVEVDPDDPAFAAPSKPIGPVYPKERASALARQLGWQIAPEGDGYRRVVPSPEPLRIRELRTIELLVEAGVLVVCAGGGGIPVVAGRDGSLRGAEAVIDKDRTAALLAERLGADFLLLLTDVPAVFEDWPEPRERPLRRAAPAALRKLGLDPGSMGPKAEAACRFVERTGRPAAIGALEEARQVLQGSAGTRVEAAASTPADAD